MKKDLVPAKHTELYFETLHNDITDFLRETFLYPVLRTQRNYLNQLDESDFIKPAIEVNQTEKDYRVKVQLPGVNKENINIKVDDDYLTITAEMQEEQEEKEQVEHNKKCHTSEFRYGRYQRTIGFDTPVIADESHAKYDNGILCITLPKKITEEKQVKHIKVE